MKGVLEMDQRNEQTDESPQEMEARIPKPPIEFGQEKISPPTFRTTRQEFQEQMPDDVKAANRISQIALFLGMAVLAVILFMLFSYF